MALVLPLELIELILDEICHDHSNRRQVSAVMSSLSLVCSVFRHHVNRIRFKAVSFVFRSSVFPRPGIRMTQFGELLNADRSVWGRRGGSNTARNAIAPHITGFSVDITAGNGYVLHLLGDGVLAKIMRKLFRKTPTGSPPSQLHCQEEKDFCKFSLTFNVLRFGGFPVLLDWTTLEHNFIDAFRYMCTTSSIWMLSLKGCKRLPTQLICESNFKQLCINSVSLERGGGLGPATFTHPNHIEHLIMDGLRFGIPDDNMILNVTEFTAYLWEPRELQTLLDIIEGILRLEKLRICMEPKGTDEELIAFDQHLPYLKTLIIDLDMRNFIPNSRSTSLSFVLGSHTPPSVQCIDIGIEIYLSDISLEGFLTSQFQNALDDYNLPSLDKELEATAVRSLSLEQVVLRLSVKHASFVEMKGLFKTHYSQKARQIVFGYFPLLSTSEKVMLEIAISVDGNQNAWRRQRRNYGD